MNTNTTRRAFVAPVSEPCNGAWHDLSDFSDLEEFTEAALAAIKKTPANNYGEELDCPDYEGFGNLFRGNYYTGLREVWGAHEWLEECESEGVEEEIALAYKANVGGNGYPDPEGIRDDYQGTFRNPEDFAIYWYQDVTGEYSSIPEDVVGFVDWRAIGERMLREGFWSADVSDGVAVFSD
jgi:hypothetical protein